MDSVHFDESSIEAEHTKLLAIWPRHQILLQVTSLVSQILDLTALRYAASDGIESWVAAMLASRQRNSIGAASRLATCGYYAPAYSILRDVSEAGLLFLYFKSRPGSVEKWTTVVGEPRHEKFRPSKMVKDLKNNGIKPSKYKDFKDRCDVYSEWGVHPSSDSFRSYVDDCNSIRTYPFADRKQFAALLMSIAQDSVLMLRSFIGWTDTLLWTGKRPTEMIEEFESAAIVLFDCFPMPKTA